MKNIIEKAAKMYEEGECGALITIIETKGSTPGKPGFKMIITEDGRTFGTVGGGCVEEGVVEVAAKVIKDKKLRTINFTLKGKVAACGGWVRVMIEPVGRSD